MKPSPVRQRQFAWLVIAVYSVSLLVIAGTAIAHLLG